METFEAGFSTVDISPDHLGYPMYGYSARKGVSTGVHDPIFAKTMILKSGQEAWSFTVLDMIGIDAKTVASIRQMVAEKTGLKAEAVMISVIHTHSAPSFREPENWDRPFDQIIAGGILEAWKALKPAMIGSSAGFLYGYHVNRRWMERPVDPSVNVLRLDDLEGNPLGIAANFGLHPVVMGYDNFLISADYVGAARKVVEKEFGCPCVFANGAAGDVNPITKNVRKQLSEKKSFITMTGAFYFGRSKETIELADRIGGTFEEVEEIGQAVGNQIVYVASGLKTKLPPTAPWSFSARFAHSDEEEEIIETMAMGIADFVLISEPGEVFVETGLDLKSRVRKLGYHFPWVVSYANDYQFYLAPEAAYSEGGYEVEMSKHFKHSPKLQSRLWEAVSKGIPQATSMNNIKWDGFNIDTSLENEEES